MAGTLHRYRSEVDRVCNSDLGSPITYAIGGLRPKTIWVQGDFADKLEALAGSQLVSQDISIAPSIADVPNPSKADRITISGFGKFYPRDWHRAPEMGSWIIYLAVAK